MANEPFGLFFLFSAQGQIAVVFVNGSKDDINFL